VYRLRQSLTAGYKPELQNCLTYIKLSWSSFVGGSQSAMAKISRHDVEELQLMVPGISAADARTVEGLVLSGDLFFDFRRQERTTIWEEIRKFDGLIPSLFSFFEDCKYLRCLRPLTSPLLFDRL
ncbi:hypothetical protein ACJ73_10061, partial [Blastomyces percursus]